MFDQFLNSLAVGLDGTVYFLSRVTDNGHPRTDLASVARPLVRR